MNHIILFSELTTGRLKSLLSGKCPYNDVLSIVRSVNTKVLHHNIPCSEASAIAEKIDFQALGYRSMDDFTISTVTGKSPEFLNISITPSCFYPLYDDFVLAKAPDKRSKLFLSLFSDEFERIKNRALYYLASKDDERLVRMYALKNLQFVKTCFHNHKPVFHDLFSLYPDYLSHPDAFIHYNLNLFLIRLRLFYEKLFEHFLPKSKKTEKQLLAELFQLNPSLMYKRNITSSSCVMEGPFNYAADSVLPEYSESHSENQSYPDSGSSLSLAFQTIAKAYKLSPDQVKQIIELKGKFKWNRQVNSLGDVLYQLMYEQKENGKPALEAHPNNVSEIFSLFCLDKQDQPISKASLKTCLQPDKTDKRPKSGSKGKIEVDKFS